MYISMYKQHKNAISRKRSNMQQSWDLNYTQKGNFRNFHSKWRQTIFFVYFNEGIQLKISHVYNALDHKQIKKLLNQMAYPFKASCIGVPCHACFVVEGDSSDVSSWAISRGQVPYSLNNCQETTRVLLSSNSRLLVLAISFRV